MSAPLALPPLHRAALTLCTRRQQHGKEPVGGYHSRKPLPHVRPKLDDVIRGMACSASWRFPDQQHAQWDASGMHSEHDGPAVSVRAVCLRTCAHGAELPPACAEISAIINFRGRSRMYLQIWVVMLRRHRHRRHRRRRPRHCLQAFQPGRLFLPHLGLQECRMRQAGPLRCQTRKSGASLAWAYCA